MSQYKILVVEDDPDILSILKDNLELDGYAAFTTTLGKDTLAIIEKELIDLVLLDVMLPDISGIQICRAIRAKSYVPVIMLTAKDSLSDKILGLESGADDYIVKPFDYLEVAARIKVCLRRVEAHLSANDIFQIGSLLIDPGKREVESNGKKIVLTNKEFDILFLLLKNAGKVMDRNSIKKEIWPDKQIYSWSRALDVHIQHLRAKIEKNPEQPRYILTVPGIGYRLADQTDLNRGKDSGLL